MSQHASHSNRIPAALADDKQTERYISLRSICKIAMSWRPGLNYDRYFNNEQD